MFMAETQENSSKMSQPSSTSEEHLHVSSKFCLIRSHLDCQTENHVSEGFHSFLSAEEEGFLSSLKNTGTLERPSSCIEGCPGDTLEVRKSFPAIT
ncbi:hypothetical protein UPYG_G00103170 [Umbra pygmaea]|uniref:Uncharacterized protein n=1 Tax=Umbra pygmaea TaxID=75934 RepID=A0ABD0XJ16_UMBPY